MKNIKYQCPQCRNVSHRIDVEATIRAALVQIDAETIQIGTEHADETSERWDEESQAWCCECRFSGPLREFRMPGNGVVIMHEHRCPETDAPLFWSNQDGWVDLRSATVFAPDENFTLPNEAWGYMELPAANT